MFSSVSNAEGNSRRQVSAVEEHFEEDLETSGAEAVDHRLDKGLLEDALPVCVADLRRRETFVIILWLII